MSSITKRFSPGEGALLSPITVQENKEKETIHSNGVEYGLQCKISLETNLTSLIGIINI